MIVLVKKNNVLLGILICVMIYMVYSVYTQKAVSTFALPTSKRVIVIDAGHGGRDPGKVGASGAYEKDLNLKIAAKLQAYLEQSGSYVLMTRIDDEGLYQESDPNKKRADLKHRKEIINMGQADIMISIHQNSFVESKYKGAQVFYHNSSTEGMKMAQYIQSEIKTFVDPSNNRQSKANTDYYILKTTDIPAVIVECGFLSNEQEEANLSTEQYQEKIAWAIYMGLVKYFHSAGAEMS
jgi:N-acetylmuramoyl-L-alanine amidase